MPEEKINDLYDKICELAHAEDGEQLEDILIEFNLMNVGYDAAWDEVERLLAALEESQQRIGKLQLYIKSLEFSRDEAQKMAHNISKEQGLELFEAQQTIARQSKAIEKAHKVLSSIFDCTSGIVRERADLTRIMLSNALGNKEGSDKA